MSSNLEKIADMHCHIVPGVDDGAQTLDESLAIIKEEYAQGVRMIILTPHWRRGMFETDRQTVKRQFDQLKESTQEKYTDLKLYLGCEFHVNPDMTDEIGQNPFFRMNGSDYVLTEFSSHHDETCIRDTINQILSSGYTPIIAHIERYPACIGNTEFIYELQQMGALIQVNADSVTGRDGWSVKRTVLKLIKDGLVDFIGSDAHNTKDRACHLLECEKVLLKKFGSDLTQKILWDHPNEIIEASKRDESTGTAYDTNQGTSDMNRGGEDISSEEKPVHHKPVTIHLDL